MLECISETAIRLESTPGIGSMPGSRETSPARAQRRFVTMKHILPAVLGKDCTTLEFRKFKREFDSLLSSSYPMDTRGEKCGVLSIAG